MQRLMLRLKAAVMGLSPPIPRSVETVPVFQRMKDQRNWRWWSERRPADEIKHAGVSSCGDACCRANPVVGVGGIMNADDAWEKICNGASLVQVYSGFIYQGPDMVKGINKGLAARLKEHGLGNHC